MAYKTRPRLMLLESVTWLGHSGFLIRAGRANVYIDPYRVADGPKADLILVTHGHYDHFGALADNHWAAFVTKGTENTLYAQLNIGGALQQVKLESNGYVSGMFRVEPTASGFRFYHDNVLVASLAGVFPDDVPSRAA